MDSLGRIQAVTDRWLLSDPLLLGAVVSHKFVGNSSLSVAMRTGRGRIEYNAALIGTLSEYDLEMELRREAMRILLKHPYQRQPFDAVPEILALASDVTIFEHAFYGKNPLGNFPDMKLPPKLSFEEYYSLLARWRAAETPASAGSGSLFPDSEISRQRQISELWEEDMWISEKMNILIEQAMTARSWGSLPANACTLLKASIENNLNVLRQLGLFKASILSTERTLTRMRPSRRYGWGQMGVRHPYTTRLLVGVDTSGSVPDADISRFFSIVNRFFSCGIPQIDVMQFDARIRPPLLTLRKAMREVKVRGRGGTSFQPVIDYFAAHGEYDGMLIFTDGYAPRPAVPAGRRILWVLSSAEAYNDFALTPKIYI